MGVPERTMSTSNEQLYYDTLKRITKYDSPEWLRRRSEKAYGLEFAEALEYCYENVKSEAERAVRGKRRPKDPAKPANRRTQSPPVDPNKGDPIDAD